MQMIKTTLTQAAAALREGRTQDASRLCEEAAAAANARDDLDLLQLAYTLRHTADIHSRIGHFELAAAQIAEAERIYRSHESSMLDLANALRIAALNQERRLVNVWRETKDLYALLGVRAGEQEALQHIHQLSSLQLPEEPQ